VSERLLRQKDDSMLESLKRLNGGTIHLPSRAKDRPVRDRLAPLREVQGGGGMHPLERPDFKFVMGLDAQ
jgi:hypothetical protein